MKHGDAINKLANSPEPLSEIDKMLHGESVQYITFNGELWRALRAKAFEDYKEPWGSGIMGASAAQEKHFRDKLKEWADLSV